MGYSLKPPFEPMEADLVRELPTGGGWQYEPKWDGFRCIAFRDGPSVYLQSKSGQDLTRYFPEVVDAVGALKPTRFVLDGELVIPAAGTLSFDDLLLRIHPAQSRIRKLAAATPAHYIVFDMILNDRGRSMVDEPLEVRRLALERFAGSHFKASDLLHISPAAPDLRTARRWLKAGGGGLDGVIAKRSGAPYTPGERTAMQKVKQVRSADCVVGGFRYASKGGVIGSLLLGLYDATGLLNHVGYTSTMPQATRGELTQRLEKVAEPPGFTGRAPGGPSRWSRFRASDEWKPVRPELVVEVEYSHFSGGRFRHGTKFLRWRPDKAPSQCTMEQVRAPKKSAASLLPGL
jgi:ATP-dependent DNA ligase